MKASRLYLQLDTIIPGDIHEVIGASYGKIDLFLLYRIHETYATHTGNHPHVCVCFYGWGDSTIMDHFRYGWTVVSHRNFDAPHSTFAVVVVISALLATSPMENSHAPPSLPRQLVLPDVMGANG
jgi:hypothetical protein